LRDKLIKMIAEIETSDRNPLMPVLDNAWSMEIHEIAQMLESDLERGLSQDKARHLLKDYGPNVLRVHGRRPTWRIFVSQFANLIIALLGAAGILSLIFEQPTEAAAIAAAILINTFIGFFTELKAARSMESLRKMGGASARVVRNGKLHKLAAYKLVPGDLIELDAGDLVPADVRLLEANRLQVDESALTGESLPVGKTIQPVAADAPLAERRSMLYKGTALHAGSAKGVVTATGQATELGRISQLTEQAAPTEDSPLQQRLSRLSQRLVWITIVVALALGLAGWLADRPWLLIVEMAVALAVAAIPEGLPIVATIALAKGMWRMAQRNAIITRLSAVETLGSTTIICTDKTGTLTANQMELTELVLPASDGLKKFEVPDQMEPNENGVLRLALETGVLCANAELDEKEEAVGDPLEGALLRAGRRAGLERADMLAELPEEREEAFDPKLKMMATFHAGRDGYRVAVKGAPEAVIAVCKRQLHNGGERELDQDARHSWQQANQDMAARGLRVIALAQGSADQVDKDPYEDLTLIALAGLWDPPRQSAAQAIEACHRAGIRVVMVTGDQAATARCIGGKLGLAAGDEGCGHRR
jgi:Ca2+-transporting ATPase